MTPTETAEVLPWRTATRSGGGNCVEVAPYNGMIAIRNSREPHGAILVYTPEEWAAFMDGAKKGEFDALA
jgi:hypothetical protein